MNRFTKAAQDNEDIQTFQTHPQWKDLWTPEILASNPPVRVEFDHVIILGTVNEAVNLAKRKSWGKLLTMCPLKPDDPLHPFRVVYLHKESSPYRQHYERRLRLKQILGTGKKLVTRAHRFGKGRFLTSLTEEERVLIATQLKISAADFWRECKEGKLRQTILPFTERQTLKGKP